MTAELNRHVINMKSLDQNIKDPIIAGAGSANSRKLYIIFTQEAAAQFTPETQVYLAWKHQQLKTRGYNVFNQVSEDPPTWEIAYPQKLLREGDVLARIELVDSISVSVSTDFIIRVLEDPIAGDSWVAENDLDMIRKILQQAADTHEITDFVVEEEPDTPDDPSSPEEIEIIDWTGGN